MQVWSATNAKSKFCDLIVQSEKEPVIITRHGHPICYVLCNRDMDGIRDTINRLQKELEELRGPKRPRGRPKKR